MLEDLLLDEPRHVRRNKAVNRAAADGVSDLSVSTASLAASYFHPPLNTAQILIPVSGFISTVFPRRSVTGREWAGRTAFRTHPSHSRARIISRQVISCRRINEVPGRPGSQSAVPLSQHLGSAPEDGVCCHGVWAGLHDAFGVCRKTPFIL